VYQIGEVWRAGTLTFDSSAEARQECLLVRLIEVDTVQVLVLSILVLYLGTFINDRVRLLRERFIPAPVTGGLICSGLVAILYATADIEISFDLRIRDVLLLVFFSTIGLSAKLKTLAAGGKALAKLVVVAAVFLVVQDVTGVGIAMLLGEHPGYGLMGGSVSLAGGHGTAIAWGAEADAAGLKGASEMGIAFATFGLIAGGLIGGPIAGKLIERYRLEGPDAQPEDDPEAPTHDARTPSDSLRPVLDAILVLAICVQAGYAVNRFLFAEGVVLPGFLTSMLVGIVLTNLADLFRLQVPEHVLDRAGDLSLNLFLSMSLMSMQLWALGDAARFITVALVIQVLVMTLFAMWVVFRVMGRDYDAAVITAGFAGMGLGATPVALANMNAVTSQHGPSPKAYLVVPLVGAFFIDLLNASTIKFFVRVINNWFL
jgi:ESS family glutamate:Na+ symporter